MVRKHQEEIILILNDNTVKGIKKDKKPRKEWKN